MQQNLQAKSLAHVNHAPMGDQVHLTRGENQTKQFDIQPRDRLLKARFSSSLINISNKLEHNFVFDKI